MLHAPPLPGSHRYDGNWDGVIDSVLSDAEALVTGGFPALMLENFGDAPFYPERVPVVTVAALTRLAVEVRSRFDVPLGINVLRNDGLSALAVAAASGASFIRVNVLTGARVADQGILSGMAHELLRQRGEIQAADVSILADVDVKHSAPLAKRPLEEEVADLVDRGGADGVIVSGGRTGTAIDLDQLLAVRHAAGRTAVYVGSGVTADNLAETRGLADGWIVGTALKQGGNVHAPIDRDRVRTFIEAYGRTMSG
ncbi:MAG: BtpA/SgcQ family protein [Planctomycetaceae bacterium]|nr:BtpA/SgcQ family protein [Planctomycetaceae bacterium]